MYDILNSAENTLIESLSRFDQESPEPLDHWSLEEFSDIVPVGGRAS